MAVSVPTVSTPGPMVQFARFENGHLRLFRARTTELEYVAISHVWGEKEWLSIPGVEVKVLISREKAEFVEKELPGLVSEGAFWMDTLTVDQTNQAEVIATVQSIPAIFRHASRTIAIRECDGIYACCMVALNSFASKTEFYQKFVLHNERHERHVRDESYLQRLWTLQECLLSHTIQFVVAKRSMLINQVSRGRITIS
jgi:hypothetical protein